MTTLGALDPDVELTLLDDPLSSASLRYLVRQPALASQPGPVETRPFALRFARTVPTPVVRRFRYCPDQQVAVDQDGRPLIEKMGKEWESKSSTDGDEGPEENWGWEEK
ncbi:putative ATP-grasp-modified RiPP [Saccharopolyspora shandongensis]|uniref:putative ATP-grasp-modified RiPP n=1 Tax=Saccharopolyspora shandongensis TaxID=418495 RepID=UPI00340B0FED